MFEFIYKRIAEGIMRNIDLSKAFIDITANEEIQKQILAMTDQLYERYKVKTLGSIGGMQKSLNFAQEGAMPNIIDNKGHISLKGLIPMFLQNFGKNQGQDTNHSLP